MKIVATHSGGFHSDDVFAVAAFELLLGKENMTVIRTRDESVLSSADYVVDVGGEYDHSRKRYDHHQNGAPVRDNGIPYAGFGLMWKHYGEEICASADIAKHIEEQLCQPIDAGDNGVNLYDLKEYGVKPFELYGIISSFLPPRGSDQSEDEQFVRAVEFARELLLRMITQSKASAVVAAYVKTVYESADNKQMLLFEQPVSKGMLVEYPDVEVIVYPDEGAINRWRATAVPKSYDTFESRVYFPQEWGGLRGEELQQVSGIKDLQFCHRNRFMCATDSKESAIEAAKQAK